MIVNPKIKEVFKNISVQSLKYANTPDIDKKYIKRVLDIYKNKITEDEQLMLLKFMLEHIHFRSIISDPDNMIILHNIKLRSYTYIFLLTSILFVFISLLFNTNTIMSNALDNFLNIFKFISAL